MNKTILLILFCGFSTLSISQVFEPDLKKLADKAATQNFQKQNKPQVLKVFPKQPIVTSTAIKPKPGVYVLPLDNMPCLVPDTKQIAAIPNALTYYHPPKIGRMPGTGNKTTSILPPKSMVK